VFDNASDEIKLALRLYNLPPDRIDLLLRVPMRARSAVVAASSKRATAASTCLRIV